MFREFNTLVKNILEQLFLLIRGKRSPLIHKLISQDTQTPIIDFIVKRFVLDNLWTKIVRSAAKSLSVSGCGLDGPAEVAEPQSVVFRNQNVFRFDIPMNDV